MSTLSPVAPKLGESAAGVPRSLYRKLAVPLSPGVTVDVPRTRRGAGPKLTAADASRPDRTFGSGGAVRPFCLGQRGHVSGQRNGPKTLLRQAFDLTRPLTQRVSGTRQSTEYV